jgi:hypothetical protein
VSVSIMRNVIKEDSIELKFAVSDTDIGISQKGKKSLFKTFSQIDSAIT